MVLALVVAGMLAGAGSSAARNCETSKTHHTVRITAAVSPAIERECIEIFGSCGLDLASYELAALVLPSTLQGDLDGDGAFDTVIQIRRRSDGKRGLALCRAGTWIHVLGMDGQHVGEALRPDYFDRMEAWRLAAKDHGPLGYVDEPAWPKSDGDVLILERIEKEIILLFWRGGALKSQQVYRYVEP